MNATRLDDLPQAELRFIEPMAASPAAELPKGDEWLYEIKLDGYRCLAGRDSRGVTLWSRRANLFTSQFPTIARAFEPLAPDTLVDGEVVAIDETGRVSFNLLQHHRSKAKAIQFYAFDLLIHSGRRLLSAPLVDVRREVFQRLKGLESADCPFANLPEKKRTPWALTREEMKNCRWLRPDSVAQIDFTEWTPDGHLREAKFVALREDKNPRHVVRET